MDEGDFCPAFHVSGEEDLVMLHRRIGLTALMAGTVVLGACSDSSPTSPHDLTPDPTAPTAERLVIEPGSVLLPGGGSSVQLRAVAYDAAGAEVAVEAVTWTSLAPEFVTVSAEGLATAVGPLGATTLVARAGALESEPVQALVAVPAGDAVLVPDASFIGTPEAEDPDAVYGLGWRYRVPVAADVAVSPGQILLASGEMPVGGRVVSVAPGAGGNIVTLELVSPAEMFDDLVFERRIDLRDAEMIIPEDVEQGFDVLRLPGGGVRFEGRDGWAPAAPARIPGPSGPARAADVISLGPLSCAVEGQFGLPSLAAGPTFHLEPELELEISWDSNTGGFQRLVLHHELLVEAKAEVAFQVSVGGSAKCAVTLATLQVPLTGPLAVIFGGQVGLSAGLGLSGSVDIGSIGYAIEGAARREGLVGLDCTVACALVYDNHWELVEESFKAGPTVSLVGITDPFHLNMSASVFGQAKFKFGNPFLQRLQFEALAVSVGPVQKLNLGTHLTQAESPNYRSRFEAAFKLSIGMGKDIEYLLGLLSESLVDLTLFELEVPLAESPHGTFSITPDRVAPGDTTVLGETATFTVALDPTTYLGGYSVEAVHIMWLRENEHGELDLYNGRPGCTTIPAVPGQTVFTCTTDFTEDHLGEQTFVAFVEAKLFGVPFPLFLKVANDGRHTVVVGRAAPVTVETAFAIYHIEADAESRRPDTVRDTTSFATDPLFLPVEYRLRNEYEPDGDLGPDEQESWTVEARVDALLSYDVNPTASGLTLGAMIEGETRASVESVCASPHHGTGTCGVRASVEFNTNSRTIIQVLRPVDYVATLEGGPVVFSFIFIRNLDTQSNVFFLQGALAAGEELRQEGTLEPGRYEINTFSLATPAPPDAIPGLLACDYRLNGTPSPGCTNPVPEARMPVVNNIQLLLTVQEPES